jgi:hypothetical protein
MCLTQAATYFISTLTTISWDEYFYSHFTLRSKDSQRFIQIVSPDLHNLHKASQPKEKEWSRFQLRCFKWKFFPWNVSLCLLKSWVIESITKDMSNEVMTLKHSLQSQKSQAQKSTDGLDPRIWNPKATGKINPCGQEAGWQLQEGMFDHVGNWSEGHEGVSYGKVLYVFSTWIYSIIKTLFCPECLQYVLFTFSCSHSIFQKDSNIFKCLIV